MYLLIACLSNDSGNFQWPLISLKQTLLAQISRCIFLIFDSEIYNTLLQDHVKVKCFWGSSEARWSSNGGCDISSFEPLHVTNKFYFLLILTLEKKRTKTQYTISVPWQCILNERLKKVHHVGVSLMKVHGLNWRSIWPLMNYPNNIPFWGPQSISYGSLK